KKKQRVVRVLQLLKSNIRNPPW
ncbi:hypothetical protein G210_1386, partial [Candida maltosa Xu316]